MGTIIQNIWQLPVSGRTELTHKDIKTEEDAVSRYIKEILWSWKLGWHIILLRHILNILYMVTAEIKINGIDTMAQQYHFIVYLNYGAQFRKIPLYVWNGLSYFKCKINCFTHTQRCIFSSVKSNIWQASCILHA